VSGVPTTSGYVSRAGDPPQTNASGITEILHCLGAVFYVKTNMSQMGFAFDSHNNLFGRTLNPLNTSLTPGGSSGGESALVALRGSILGVGTDSLGSLRTPAHATGLYTIKPSPNRIPFGGMQIRTRGAPGNPLHVGPIANSIDDLKIFMQAVIQSEPWKTDATLSSCPWTSHPPAELKKRMKIGVIVEDESLPLYPPMQKTMTETMDKLTKANHEVIRLTPGANFPQLMQAARLTFQFAIADPYSSAFAEVLNAGEPFVPSVAMSLPSNETREQMKPTLEKLIATTAQREELAQQVLNVWRENELDAIVMPLHNTVAPPVDTWASGSYLAIWNLLPYPSIVLPFGKADEQQDAAFEMADPNLEPKCKWILVFPLSD
jgi:amidase